MTILTRQTLLATGDTAASTGAWYPLDFRNDPGGSVRTFTGKLTAGDTVYFEVTNEAPYVNGAAVSVSVIVTVSAYTDALFASPIYGQWSAIRFRKTGTAGTCVVNGIV